MSSSSPSSSKKAKLLHLDDASQHQKWKDVLQDHMFNKFHNVDMDKLTPADTLEEKYFKGQFKEQHKALKKMG